MTEQLKQAAQQALEALKNARHGRVLEGKSIDDAIYTLTRALTTSQPAQAGEVDDGDVTGQPGPLPETGWDEVPAGAFRKPSPTAGMNLGQRIQHVGGRENAAGYIEFGSVAAVRALVRQYLRDLPAPQQATPEPVGVPAAWRWFNSNGDQVTNWLDFKPSQKANVEAQVAEACGRIEYAYTHPAPGVPEVEPNEMESAWCWWVGDGERFHIVDTESEAHGEAQCHIDDDCDPGQTHEYSVTRVQHPLDALGMDWLALHVAESIDENVCCWCDDNTGAEEPSIMLSPDDRKALGVMVAAFLRQRVGVEWWTADQKTVTLHTYVSGSNDNPALAAAQAKGGA